MAEHHSEGLSRATTHDGVGCWTVRAVHEVAYNVVVAQALFDITNPTLATAGTIPVAAERSRRLIVIDEILEQIHGNHIRIPTTLIGLVDTGVGVKTGVNFGAGKNKIGNYAAPAVTYMDRSFLRLLSRWHLRSESAFIPGDHVTLIGTGADFTWGCAVLRYHG